MSGFERALLEDKDRDELAQIAEMLGRKPPARSRKATIINLILELAGVTDAAAAEPAAAVEEPTATVADPTTTEEQTTPDGPGDDTDGRGPGDDADAAGDAGDSGPSEGGSPDEQAGVDAGRDPQGTDGRPERGPSPRPDGPGGRPVDREASGDRPASRQGGGNGTAATDADGRDRDHDQVRRSPPGPDQSRRSDQGRRPDEGRSAEPERNGDLRRSAGQGRDADPGRDGDQGRGAGQSGRSDQGGEERPGKVDPNQGQGAQGRGQGRPGESDPNQRQSGQGQSGQNQNPNQQQGGHDGSSGSDEDEGNRRRRRRGRNRDGQPELYEGDPIDVEGLLDLRDDGYGFLRLGGYLPSSDDVYVSVKQVRQFGLRKGDLVAGKSRPASRNEKNPALLQIDAVNGGPPDAARERRRFEDLTPLFPDSRLRLETQGAAANMTTRIVDLLAPVGKGQRGLIVSPPKAGKTTVMKQIARAIELNDPDVELIVLLVDERPEEVTDMRRWLIKGTVASSTFDRPSEEHIAVAELVIERAKRMVEAGRDVAIIVDGITRLARAYNLAQPPSGRIMSGGIDAGALYPPKRFFGAARNAEEGGSLTILATTLVETGSKMDEHIFEEFKGTGNMELKLDRRLADRRIFPAIDVDASSTRHEELLFERKQVAQVTTLRKMLGALKDSDGSSDAAALELLIDRLGAFKTNDDFLAEIAKAKAPA